MDITEASTKRLNLKMRKNPPLKGRIKPKLRGVGKDARQKVADLAGGMDDLRLIFDLEIVRGLYLRLLLKQKDSPDGGNTGTARGPTQSSC